MRKSERLPRALSPTLIADLHRIVDASQSEAALVTAVAGRLASDRDGRRQIIHHLRKPEPGRYLQEVLYVSPDGRFSIVSLVWGPGAQTCIHNHAGWCVAAVYEGLEHERRYRIRRDPSGNHLEQVSSSSIEAGSTVSMVADGLDIHRVANDSREVTVSMHIYGLDIERVGSSIKSRYDALPVVA